MENLIEQELTELLTVLEARLPANPKSPRNEKLSNELTKAMSSYFQRLEVSFPYRTIKKIYAQYAPEDKSA